MLVLVGQAGMFVQMRMRFGNRPFVLVLMMLVVNVQMLMKHDLVHMEMTMSLSDQHPHSNDHERGASEFRQTGKIAKHRNRKQCTDERSRCEVRRLTRGAQLTQRFHGQHNTDPVTQRSNYSRGDNSSRSRKSAATLPKRQHQDARSRGESFDSSNGNRVT